MANWKDVKYGFDWKSILLTAGMLIGFALLCITLLNRGHIALYLAQRNLNRVAQGQIISKYNNVGLKQTNTGNKLSVNNITVYYQYMVNGQTYHQKQVLDYSLTDAVRLNEIFNAKPPIPVTVLYDNNDPRRSSISLENLKSRPLFPPASTSGK